MRRKLTTVVLTALAAILAAAAPASAAGHAGSTTVTRGLTYTEFFPDDICGPRASVVTFNFLVQALHTTERNGTFNVQYTEVKTYHVDFVDPTLADQDSRLVDSIHHVFTPGQVEMFNETFHDFPGGVRIWYRDHETYRNDVLVVEHEVERVTGCP